MNAALSVRAFVGVGANLGDPRAQVVSAIAALQELPDTKCTVCSSLYASSPVDAPGPTTSTPCRAANGLTASQLLQALHELEARHGRTRSPTNAPRTLDLDLLLYGEQRSDDPTLTLPHPRLHQRAFVLKPLLEIAPQLQVDGLGPLSSWLQKASDQAVRRLAGEELRW
jgi:2-amino-4-hydroxy-6-hydroxymethyldihydropteridine diphosphokinase